MMWGEIVIKDYSSTFPWGMLFKDTQQYVQLLIAVPNNSHECSYDNT